MLRYVILVAAFTVLAVASGVADAASYPYQCVRDWYVATNGVDSYAPGAGTTAATPFATLQRAANASLEPGDCIQVAPGTYNQGVGLYTGGTTNSPTGFVALVSTVPGAAKIVAPSSSYAAVGFGASYLIVDGFDISGGGGGDCVSISAITDRTNGYGIHHLVVINNVIHDCGGGGITAAYGDYYYFVGNEIYGTSATNYYQTSGISVYEPRVVPFVSTPADSANGGYDIIVGGNISHDNEAGPTITATHTDGNGIIVDDFDNLQRTDGIVGPSYPHRTLVINNIVFNNGGKGVALYRTNNVSIINNTSYNNNIDTDNPATWRGEFNNSNGNNNLWENNIGWAVTYPAPDPRFRNSGILDAAIGSITDRNTTWLGNLTFDGVAGSPSAVVADTSTVVISATANYLGQNPLFENVAANDFTLLPGSPALGKALAVNLPPAIRYLLTMSPGAYWSTPGAIAGSTTTPTQNLGAR